ncbi:enoyl-CoA hydratase [Solimonas aquatica]|uniref:Enoyl-CoA hydratase n=1 Tax=Solimonas aquatica TaxID=489703 RepID=A0A1H9L728_9GAMM|nr:crotonase/enoyl-CoA hydratase family protein [Solimonas aquatica]SER07118.1 enoyl-CoA hydratase [Solimonas aquatica]
MSVAVSIEGPLHMIQIRRPAARNAVDRATAEALAQAFGDFESDANACVAVLSGEGQSFCAGADLKAVASGDPARMNRLAAEGDGPMGPTRMQLSKPVIAMIRGACVAGGLELALWCDLRVADHSAEFGVYCRRFGVPLIDGGTVRLPRLIGQSRAMDMILSGRRVSAEEAHAWGLLNRLCAAQTLEQETLSLARQLAALPQRCLRSDRRSVHEQWSLSETAAIQNEFALGLATLQSGESRAGAQRFAQGQGRHGETPG